MDITMKEVLQFVNENDVKFIKLAFCDLFGQLKSISIMPDELPRAFESGISFDAHAIRGFSDITKSDLLLYPDPSTLSVLSWRPQQGRVARFYCEVKDPSGKTFFGDTRSILKTVTERLRKKGLECSIGAECEFYLFKTDENGEPVRIPYDNGGYLDVAPLDRGENIRREICINLEEMGIKPESSHHEQGPGQNEIDFQFSDALRCADNLLTFKAMVKAIAARNGLFASFMPKPLPGKSGNGLHMNLSLFRHGQNLFKVGTEEHSTVAESFIAGILAKAAEMSLFLNPLPNSYERLGAFEAPKYVSWSHQNRSQLVRIPAATEEKARMELRSPDPSVNPYLAFALVISAGLDGIENNIPLPKAVDADLYHADDSITSCLTRLPETMAEALSLARNSDFIKGVFGERAHAKFIEYKTAEEQEFALSVNKEEFYYSKYFNVI